MNVLSDHYFFLGKEDPYITVETHEYKDDDDKPIENARIEINTEDSNLLLQISLQKDSLKKLIIAGRKFLDSGKRASFCGDEFCLGEIRNREIVQAKKVLKEGI